MKPVLLKSGWVPDQQSYADDDQYEAGPKQLLVEPLLEEERMALTGLGNDCRGLGILHGTTPLPGAVDH
jgi:hypothetical protein